MSEISPRRRRAAHWLIGAGVTLALPLTATVVYAGQDAPAAPLAPFAPDAPAAAETSVPPEAPAVPQTPAAPKKVKQVVMIHSEDRAGETDGKAKFERRIERDGKTVVPHSEWAFDEAEFEAKMAVMEANLEKLDHLDDGDSDLSGWIDDGEGRRKLVVRRGAGPVVRGSRAVAFEGRGCASSEAARTDAEAGADGANRSTRSTACSGGAPHEIALKAVRQARSSIANDGVLNASIRATVLKQLDQTIADMEKDAQ